MLNCLRNLRNPSRFASGRRELLTHGGALGLESECLWRRHGFEAEKEGYLRMMWQRLRNVFPGVDFKSLDACCDPDRGQIAVSFIYGI